ncbi:MAG TPA: DUF4397 domain-containing protein [Gemmatimonadaceae bacterium]|jgi:hypothetical protein
MSDRFTMALSAAALASLALVVSSCSGSDATEPGETANVRFANASATTSTITVQEEERTAVAGLAFQNTNAAAGCASVEHGTSQNTVWFLGGTTNQLASMDVNFGSGNNYTSVFYGPNNVAVYLDSFTAPATGQNAIRFVNATSSAGDIYLTAPSDVITSTSTPTIGNLGASQISGFNSSSATGGTFVSYADNLTRVRMFDVGVNTGTPRADFTIDGASLPSNRVTTVILTPAASSGATGFNVNPCGS